MEGLIAVSSLYSLYHGGFAVSVIRIRGKGGIAVSRQRIKQASHRTKLGNPRLIPLTTSLKPTPSRMERVRRRLKRARTGTKPMLPRPILGTGSLKAVSPSPIPTTTRLILGSYRAQPGSQGTELVKGSLPHHKSSYLAFSPPKCLLNSIFSLYR